jgi:hypothetical protein
VGPSDAPVPWSHLTLSAEPATGSTCLQLVEEQPGGSIPSSFPEGSAVQSPAEATKAAPLHAAIAIDLTAAVHMDISTRLLCPVGKRYRRSVECTGRLVSAISGRDRLSPSALVAAPEALPDDPPF